MYRAFVANFGYFILNLQWIVYGIWYLVGFWVRQYWFIFEQKFGLLVMLYWCLTIHRSDLVGQVLRLWFKRWRFLSGFIGIVLDMEDDV